MMTLHQDCIVYTTKKNYENKTVKLDEQKTKCRAKEKYQLVINQNAEKVTSTIEFTMYPSVVVDLGYLVEYEGKAYKVIAINITRNTIGEIVKKAVFV